MTISGKARGGVLSAAVIGLGTLCILAPAGLLLGGWIKYKRLEKSIVQKMDQYYLDITVPGREEYLLEDDEVFEVPYMASKLSVQAQPTRIYDIQDRLIGEYLPEKGLYVRSPSGIPALMKKALVATEDGDFYEHHGVNYKAVVRATLMNLKSLRGVQGGSTLTQQLAKMLFTTRQKTLGRKAFEVFAARKLESKFTKDQLLLMYLNYAYFGHGCYGIESAARFYFDKPADALGLGEAAMLAGIIASPDNYSPFTNAELTRARVRTVLRRMAKRGFIPEAELNRYEEDFWAVMSERVKNPEVSFWRMSVNKAPPFIEVVRRELAKSFSKERIMKGGLTVRTTLDLDLQTSAAAALREGLRAVNAEIAGGSKPAAKVEGGLAAVRPSDGAILAMVGGSAFSFRNQLNRAADISRPIGSSVKPFVYAAAFSDGAKPGDVEIDEPVSYKMSGKKRWTPHNYDGKYSGEVTLATALHKSINTVAVKLLARIGPRAARRLLGAAMNRSEDSFPDNLSLALGTAEASPLELAAAYAIFGNGGFSVAPYFIRSIEDRDGKVLGGQQPAVSAAPVLDPGIAAMTRDVMRGVLEEGGTAYSAARAIGFSVPAAGKTGTTSDYKDAWFAGLTPDLSAAVWLGYDDMRLTMGKGKSGGTIAAPIWLRFVKEYYRDRPTREFIESRQ